MAVSSGTRDAVDSSLKIINVYDPLAFTICEGDTARGKPFPDPYELGFQRLYDQAKVANGTLPDKARCVVIDDSLTGAEAGGLSGIPTIYWKHHISKPDSPHARHNITGPDNLRKLLERITANHPAP